MRKTNKLLHLFLGAAGASVLLFAFNNCGEGFVAERLYGGGGNVLFSQAPGQTCEDALLEVYKSTYHPFLSQTCNNCHISGPGIGTFASPDAKTSYTSFASVGAEKISSQAVNDNHKPPYTGAKNAPLVDSMKASWANAQVGYASCLSASGGGSSSGSVVRTNGKAIPANLGVTNFVRMEWDLSTESASKLPLVAGIDVRLGAVTGVTRGYEYRNPTLRLKTAGTNYRARALNIFVNNLQQSEVTTYSNIDVTISATTDTNISPGTANAFNTRTVAAGDTLALEFSSLGVATANPGATPTPPPGATPTPTPPATAVTFTQLTANGGLFRTYCYSCHSGANVRGGLDISNYTAAKNSASSIRFRVNNAANPMPTGGLLLSEQRDQINAWVDSGAPQ